jgi:hypothetical protein
MADFNLADIDLGSGADIDGFLSSPNEGGGSYMTSTILQTIMPKKSYTEYDLRNIQNQGTAGIDALFSKGPPSPSMDLPGLDALYAGYQPPPKVNTATRKVVASMSDLRTFTRISSETLVHKSNNDLWSLRKEADGKFYIERLFDDNGEPLKG